MAIEQRVLAITLLAATTLSSSVAFAEDWEVAADEVEKVPRNGFSTKAYVGPSYHALYSHPMGTVMGGVALGAQFKDIGALHGTFLFQLGATDAGLRTTSYGGSVTWEHIFGRVRPGIGVLVQQFHLERATSPGTLAFFGGGLTGFLSVDVVQSPHANFFIGLNGELIFMPDETVFPGAWLNFGGRFKAP